MSVSGGDVMVERRELGGRLKMVIDAMDASYDDQRSTEMFDRLMMRLQVEEQRRRHRSWLWRTLSAVAGAAVAGAGALHLLH